MGPTHDPLALPPWPLDDGGEASLFDLDALAEPTSGPADDPTLLSGPSAIASLGMRARAVAYTRPLHELESSKVRLGGEAWVRLNLVELGFHAIDVVALRMDFDSGARHDDVVAALAALARHQDPDLVAAEARRAGERVLDGLISGRGQGDAEAHQATYGSWGPDGYVPRRFDYALLTEHVDGEGEFYLRATDPAISVLMGALEVDVESAQRASELRLNELVRRGLLSAAIHEAQRAKYRTIQYTNQLARQLNQAQLHTYEAGALAAVDELVDRALAHVVDRYQAERAIIANVARARDDAEDAVARRRANQLVAELEQCEIRHQHLQRRLLRARAEFRRAHAEQLAAGPVPARRVDVERQLLRPTLRAPLARADRLATLLFRLATAPQAPALVDLDQLTGALCALPPEADELGGRVDDGGDLVDHPGRRRFDDDAWDAVDAVLASVDEPTSLTALLARLRSAGSAAQLDDELADARAHLLTLRAVHGFDPALGEQLRQAEKAGGEPEVRLLWWAPTGERFADGTIEGDELMVAPAWLVAAEAGGPTEEAHDGR
jgi:hypothetical protein